MAKLQHAARQQEPQLFWELRRERSTTKYQMCATSGCLGFRLPAHADVGFSLSSLVGLISHQPTEVRVKPFVILRDSGNTALLLSSFQTRRRLGLDLCARARWPVNAAGARGKALKMCILHLFNRSFQEDTP